MAEEGEGGGQEGCHPQGGLTAARRCIAPREEEPIDANTRRTSRSSMPALAGGV
jgi:hypothetical protein